MTTNKQLREPAEGAAHWSGSLAHVWPSDPDFNDAWTVGTIDEDGNKYPVIEVDADQYDAPGDSERLARFFTAANPAAVLALLDSYEALQAELERERKRRFDGNEQASREHREDMKSLVEALETLLEVRVIEADASYGLACAKAEQALAAHRSRGEV